MHFRTGFYEDEFYIDDPKRIAREYLKGWFFLDLATRFGRSPPNLKLKPPFTVQCSARCVLLGVAKVSRDGECD